jgi:hypothetical protein
MLDLVGHTPHEGTLSRPSKLSAMFELNITAFTGLASVEVVRVDSTTLLLEARIEPQAGRERPTLRLVRDED